MIQQFGYAFHESNGLQKPVWENSWIIIEPGPVPKEAAGNLVPNDFRLLHPVIPADPPKRQCKPSKFLLYSVGTRGDIQPVAVLGALLQKRGYTAYFVSTDDNKAFVESFGLQFFGIGVNHEVVKASVGQEISSKGEDFSPYLMRVIYDDVSHLVTRVLQICQEHVIDCFVQMTAAGVSLQDLIIKHLDIPIVNLELYPRGAFSKDSLNEYCRCFLKARSYAANYGFNRLVQQAYDDNKLTLKAEDSMSLSHTLQMLNLAIYSSSVSFKHPMFLDGFKRCGFFFEEIPQHLSLSEELKISWRTARLPHASILAVCRSMITQNGHLLSLNNCNDQAIDAFLWGNWFLWKFENGRTGCRLCRT
jgi:hypothetical protein